MGSPVTCTCNIQVLLLLGARLCIVSVFIVCGVLELVDSTPRKRRPFKTSETSRKAKGFERQSCKLIRTE